MTSVEINQICHQYGDKMTLDHVDLAVRDHTYLVVLGKTGSGKTTLLHLIAGLMKPSKGSISIGGSRVDAVAPRHRSVSMVFQDPSLFPHLNIRKNLTMGLKTSNANADVPRAVELTKIDDLLDRYPDQISGGQQRKVAIAAAICQAAEVRLFDEPLASLDLLSRQAIESDLIAIHRAMGGTTIHVTHDGGEAMRVADQIAVLEQGRVVQIDSPAKLYDHPMTLAAANSIADIPVNCWHGDCGQGDCGNGDRMNSRSTELKWIGDIAPDPTSVIAVRAERMQISRDFHKSGLYVSSRSWRVRRLRDRMLWTSQRGVETDAVEAGDGESSFVENGNATASIHAITSIEQAKTFGVEREKINATFYVEPDHVMFFDKTGNRRIDRKPA